MYRSPPLTIEKSKNVEQAVSNKLYVGTTIYNNFFEANGKKTPIYVDLKGAIFIIDKDSELIEEGLRISSVARSFLRLSHITDKPNLTLHKFPAGKNIILGNVVMKARAPRLSDRLELKELELIECFQKLYKHHCLQEGQEIYTTHNV